MRYINLHLTLTLTLTFLLIGYNDQYCDRCLAPFFENMTSYRQTNVVFLLPHPSLPPNFTKLPSNFRTLLVSP